MEESPEGAREWRPDAKAKYLLAMVTLFYFLAIVDRGIFSILGQAIKQDLKLSDLQLGLLGGVAFALFYGGFSLPAGRLAERFNRINIISSAVVFWSLATALSGAAANFIQLAVARAAVGGGEAACHPCAHSLIADSYPPERRASAAGLFSLAIPGGTLFGLVGGAYLAQNLGWRWAFVVVGLPGLFIALLAKATVAEPPRGRYDPPSTESPPPYSAVLRHLMARRTFRHMTIGWILTTAAWAGAGSFMPPYLLRSQFGLDTAATGWILGILSGAGALAGTLAGGFLADRFGKRDPRAYLWIPAASLFVTGPALAGALLQNDLTAFIAFAAIGYMCMLVYIGPCWGTLHNLVEPRMRASAVATLSVLVAVIGAGVGPVLTGLISDVGANLVFAGDFTATCGHAASEACQAASFLGLRYALICTVLLHVIAGIHFWLASGSIGTDLVARPDRAVGGAEGAARPRSQPQSGVDAQIGSNI